MMIATGFALANETKFDKSVEAAAARIAASKLGEIRSTIDHDEVAFIVTRKVLRKQEAQLNLLPRPAWVPPKPEGNLPPMVSNQLPDLDYSLTGSIRATAPKSRVRRPYIRWERFDGDGNPLD